MLNISPELIKDAKHYSKMWSDYREYLIPIILRNNAHFMDGVEMEELPTIEEWFAIQCKT